MTPFLRKLLGLNWLLLANMLALAIFGVVAIYSATYMRQDPTAAEFWRKQANWVAVGFFRLHGHKPDRLSLDPLGRAADVSGRSFFLILTRFIGTKVYGSRSWLHLGPINFQPAQLAVVAGIMVLALFLSQFRQMHPMLRLTLCGAIVGAPCLLILMQPDLGECIIWGPVLLALLFVGGIPLRYLICVVLIAVAFIPVAYIGLKPYQQERITAFINPDIDRQGSAWAINQSLIAIGSGGWSGKGFKAPNTQIELGFLPATAVHNDYIFSAIGEQWGFVGGIALLSAFASAVADVSFCGLRGERPVWTLVGHRNHHPDFHPHLPECRNDHLHPADHRRAVAAHQLQRLVRAHDHVRPRDREQRLGPSQSAGALRALRRFCDLMAPWLIR